MRTFYFTLPRMNISLGASEDILEKISLFYPRYIHKKKPLTITHAYEINEEHNQWIMQKDGRILNVVASEDHAVFTLEYDVEISLLQNRGNWLAVHAGCVAIGESACLIAGNPDSGKTTTTFNLVEMGHRFMCEEIALADTKTKEVHPFLQTLAMKRGFIEDVKKHYSIKAGKILRLNSSLVRYSPDYIQKNPLKLSTILVPCHDPNVRPQIVPLNSSEFLTEFLCYCFEPNVNMEEFVDSVIGLLEECRIYRVCYRDYIECRRLLHKVFPSASA